MLPNMENRTLWHLNLSDLGTEVEAKDGFGDIRKGYLSRLQDEETHTIYDDVYIVQHMRREVLINGESYCIWDSSTMRRADYK